MTPEVHLFIIWSEARAAEARIVEDIAERFAILDVADVTWSTDTFRWSLTRFYGTALPPDSDKERHCGTGPFLVIVVEDRDPVYRRRRLTRGRARVNSNVIDARTRYREWTGGGFRVHASEHAGEADRDLVLLFGERAADFRGRVWDGEVRPHPHDPVGTTGWRDVSQLLLALEVTGGHRQVTPPDGADLALEVGDLWWAEQVAGGTDLGAGRREIVVGGQPLRLALIGR